MRLNHHIVIALSVLLSFSCIQKAKIEVVTELTETQEAVTKADTPTVLEGEFDFSVRDKDIWAYIERQKDFPRVLSIEPRVREGDTLMFIANLEQGWKIFSADKHLPPIVAEIPAGSFEQKTIDNPGVIFWMEDLMDLTIKLKQEKALSSANKYTDMWVGYSFTKRVGGSDAGVKGLSQDPTWTRAIINEQMVLQQTTYGPYLSTNWGQGSPWNSSLPIYQVNQHFPTGCVAVAVSQLLYYYHYAINCPSGLYHDIAISNWVYHSGNQPYYTSILSLSNYQYPSSLWGSMVLDSTEYVNNDPTSLTGAAYVSDLMVDVGNRVNMHYYADASGSGSSITYAQPALATYGLASNYATFNASTVVAEMVNERPIYLRGANNTSGHAWVVDGAKKYQYVTYITYQWWMGYLVGSLPNGEEMTQEQAIAAAWEIGLDKPEDGMITYGVSYTEPYYSFHMNWGWDGILNGFFFDDGQIILGEGGGTISYSSYQQMLYNIHANSN